MGRESAISHQDMHSYNSDNTYLLLNFAASVYIFHKLDKFTNFKRAIREQKLFCGTEIILIKRWEEISLLLRIENWTSIMLLKEITYVLNFPLNLVLLAYFKDKDYKYYYWLGEICNKKTL